MKKQFGSERGALEIGAVILLIIVVLLTMVLVQFAQRDAKWTIGEVKTTQALALAEMGLENGYQQLIISTTTLANAEAGIAITGYNLDKTYTEPDGGTYEVRLSSTTGGAIVTSVGRDKDKQQIRSLQAVYALSTGNTTAPIFAGSYSASGSSQVYWGPIMSQSSISLSGNANTDYPRKYAAGSFSGNGGMMGTRNYCPPSPPTQGPGPNYEWYCDYPVPTAPVPNFTYYRQLALSQGSNCGGNPCYNSAASPNFAGTNDTVCTVSGNPKIWYFEGSPTFTGHTYFCGILISLGTVNFSGQGNQYITVTPPSTAWQDYQVGTPNGAGNGADTSATDEYPGDNGLHTVKPFDFSVGGGGYSSNKVTFQGYAYSETGFSASGGTVVVGAVQTGVGGGSGGTTVFYEPQTIVTGGGSSNNNLVPPRTSWQDFTGCSWTGTHPVCN